MPPFFLFHTAQKISLAAEPFAAPGIIPIVRGSLRDSQGQKDASSTVKGAGGVHVFSAGKSQNIEHIEH
jgi:hypothetical protein